MNRSGAYGVASMTGRLHKVAMRRPGAILTADHKRWHYTKPLDPNALLVQYQAFVELIEQAGVEIEWLPDSTSATDSTGQTDDLADSIFTYDPSFVIPGGAIVLRPGKELRRPEAALHESFYRGRMPVLGAIEEPGTVEGGDCFFLDERTLAVGRGFRTNQAGIDQLRAIVEPLGLGVEAFDLPYLHGPQACLHLLSVVSPLDKDLALVYEPLMPTALHQRMTELGYRLLAAPADEFESSLGLNLNVLATEGRRCIAIDGFPKTAQLMIDAGCVVTTFAADELCIACEGGPTCLTRPLLRSST